MLLSPVTELLASATEPAPLHPQWFLPGSRVVIHEENELHQALPQQMPLPLPSAFPSALPLTLDNLPFPACTTDENGLLTACNKALSTSHGRAQTSLIGTHFTYLIHPDDLLALMRGFQDQHQLPASPQPWSLPVRLLNVDQSAPWTVLHTTPITTLAGTLCGAHLFFLDETAVRPLKGSQIPDKTGTEASLTNVFAALPHAIVVLNREGLVVEQTPAARENALLGLCAPHLPIWEIPWPSLDARQTVRELFFEASKGNFVTSEITLASHIANGTPSQNNEYLCQYEVSMKPLFDTHGQLDLVILECVDISMQLQHVRSLEGELRSLKTQYRALQAADLTRQDFLNQLQTVLRRQISLVTTSLEAGLLRDLGTSPQKAPEANQGMLGECFQLMRQCLEATQRFSNRLRSFLDSGRLELDFHGGTQSLATGLPQGSTSDSHMTHSTGHFDYERALGLPRVLIATSHTELAQSLETGLAMRFDLRVSTNASQAFALAQCWEPECILADTQLMFSDGTDLCKTLRGHRSTHRIPLVALASSGRRETLQKTLDAGADDVLFEPFHVPELLSRVRTLMTLGQERKRIEETGKRHEIQCRSQDMLEHFVWVASHDLKEPLRRIQALCTLKSGEKLFENSDDGTRERLKKITDASDCMNALVDGLLELSRAARRRPAKKLHLREIALEVIESQKHLHPQITAEIQVEIPILAEIEADPMQIRQLLSQLMSNAFKFTAARPVRIGIKASFQKLTQLPVTRDDHKSQPAGDFKSSLEGDVCRVEIHDNGIGFDERHAERIFLPFQRLNERGNGPAPGTGIGLAICRRIVERHGGLLVAKSTEGVGSMFVVTLPCKQPRGD